MITTLRFAYVLVSHLIGRGLLGYGRKRLGYLQDLICIYAHHWEKLDKLIVSHL